MCGHEVPTLRTYSEQHGVSAACLYVDAIGTFESVVRDLICGADFGDEFSDEWIAQISIQFGFSPDDMHELFPIPLTTILPSFPESLVVLATFFL